MLVGDVIIGARELIPDLPRGLSISTTPAIAAASVASPGSTLPATSYYVRSTFIDRWGETIASGSLGPIIVGANQGIQISGTVIPTGSNTRLRVYIGQVNGGENIMYESSSVPFTISSIGLQNVPPTRPSNFYPDADGGFVSAATIYRWLNEALEEACKIAGGIPDETGISTASGIGAYTLPGQWNKLTDAWYDGYPIAWEGQESLFYRNIVSGYATRAVVKLIADRVTFELQPQPNRTAGSTTLNGGITDTADSATVVTTAGFLLPLGLVQIGNEVMSYGALTGTVISGLIRGLGGTTQEAHANGEAVKELNFRSYGLRQFTNPTYQPGDFNKTLVAPSGWRVALIHYILNKVRTSERRFQEADRDFKLFTQLISGTARGNKLVSGPRQVGGPTSQLETYPAAGIGGRLIIP